WGIAIFSALYSPLLILLRNPPSRAEIQPLKEGRVRMSDTKNAEALKSQPLGGTLGYDPTEGGQKLYNYGED
ncbi:unnamed protein product, partial [Hymenolepis diminuta]